MAVLGALPGVEVSVSAGGQDLTEYEDIREELDGPLANKTVLRYIEATSDTEFEVNLKVSPPFRHSSHNISFFVFADGEFARARACSAAQLRNGHWRQTVSGVESHLSDGTSNLRRFYFTPIKTVDDSDSLRIQESMREICGVGELIIKVFRMNEGEKWVNGLASIAKDAPSEIAEKAIKGKALSHGTSFRPPIPTTRGVFCRPSYLDGRDKPIGVFNFRYRSKEALQQQLIIPRTPTPDPYDSLTPAEVERLARQRLAQLRTPRPKVEVKSENRIKRERDDGEGMETIDLTNEDVVQTVKTRPCKMIKMPDGNDAIDLTN